MPTFSGPLLTAVIAAAPWYLAAPVLATRARGWLSLADARIPARGRPGTGDSVGPRVSVVLPARNEAAHIEACLRSLQASTWPDLEIVVIDDHSTDGTGALARAVAGDDDRVRVIDAPVLPAGWFGKQWACHCGVGVATGSILLFTDADTRHAPDLIDRMVAMRAARGAELLSVAGRQEMVTFWERAVQPLMFAIILMRYGSSGALERATRASDVVANGQCFMLSRDGYDAIGGHERVRAFVAEDLMMAQAVWRSGRRVSMALGLEQLSTRMYDGLGALVRGWSKNVYAGGRHSMRGGRAGRVLFPFLLLSAPLFALIPPLALLVLLIAPVPGAFAPVTRDPVLLWSGLATAGVLAAAALVNRANGDPWHRAWLALPGAPVLLAICAIAIAKRNAVEWKDRSYTAH